jgi:hypothetical protein
MLDAGLKRNFSQNKSIVEHAYFPQTVRFAQRASDQPSAVENIS